MSIRVLLTAAVVFGAALAAPLAAMASDTAPPGIIVSFDGVRDNSLWQRSLTLGRETGARFTYFVSCVNLLSDANRERYQPPDRKRGTSNVGFGGSTEDVSERLKLIWQAHLEGHEIASHGCGHFDGKSWSRQDWAHEFAQFQTVMRDAWTINGTAGEPEGWKAFAETAITGFRAPYLATGKPLFAALGDAGFRYDASTVSNGIQKPVGGGVRRFSLPLIAEGPRQRPIIAMDYNLFARHSKAEETPDTDGVFEARASAAFGAALQGATTSAPLQIGFHFVLMNDGAYWRALERFARDNCSAAKTACVSYAGYLGKEPPEAIKDEPSY
jgi:peptidoglycan/xylan/chitin deacetylase (PgdA/CDA1 family)